MALLDTKHRILGTRTVYQGSVNQKRESTGTQTRGPDRQRCRGSCFGRMKALGGDTRGLPNNGLLG